MPRFILKFKMRGRLNRDRPDKVEREEIMLGLRPLADVYVPDRPGRRGRSRSTSTERTCRWRRGRLAGVSSTASVDAAARCAGSRCSRPRASSVRVTPRRASARSRRTSSTCRRSWTASSRSQPAKPFALNDLGRRRRWGKSAVLSRELDRRRLRARRLASSRTPTRCRAERSTRHRSAPWRPDGCAAVTRCRRTTSARRATRVDATATHPYAKAGI